MIATSSSTLGRGIAKRATAAVRQRATAHEKQHYQRTLATTIDNGRFGLGSIRDHDDDDDDERDTGGNRLATGSVGEEWDACGWVRAERSIYAPGAADDAF
mmetsp:Transcript_10626/g.22406  ORF Transcript_10626/g.22406 Transcript_10626/m.22406 type:complete len:101 (-) Transcript_10626:161-463(-)